LKKIRRFIYLISPNKISNKNFYKNLEILFKTKKISFFQLRLKHEKKGELIKIGKKINKLTKKYD
jgi:Thiamine monophosphate synthase/TENI.